MTYCCKLLESAINNDHIEDLSTEKETIYRIFGSPQIVDDGDGYFDDMTEHMVILFCPFCGHRLTKGGNKP